MARWWSTSTASAGSWAWASCWPSDELESEQRLLMTAARRAVGPSLRARAGELVAEPDTAFSLGEREEILWRGAAVARLRATGDRLAPRIELLADPMLDSGTAGRARQRLQAWLQALARRAAGSLGGADPGGCTTRRSGPRPVASPSGCTRPWAASAREEVESLLPALTAADRAALGRLGVRFGWHHLFLPALLKPAAVEARVRLWRLATGTTVALPPAGRTVLRGAEVPPGEAALIAGFATLGDFALRVDVLERLAAGGAGAGAPDQPVRAAASARGRGRARAGPSCGSWWRPWASASLHGEGEMVFAWPRGRRAPRRRQDAPEKKRRAMAGAARPRPSPSWRGSRSLREGGAAASGSTNGSGTPVSSAGGEAAAELVLSGGSG